MTLAATLVWTAWQMISEVKWCFFYSYFVIYIFYLEGNNIEEWEAKDIGICAQKKLYKVRNENIVNIV